MIYGVKRGQMTKARIKIRRPQENQIPVDTNVLGEEFLVEGFVWVIDTVLFSSTKTMPGPGTPTVHPFEHETEGTCEDGLPVDNTPFPSTPCPPHVIFVFSLILGAARYFVVTLPSFASSGGMLNDTVGIPLVELDRSPKLNRTRRWGFVPVASYTTYPATYDEAILVSPKSETMTEPSLSTLRRASVKTSRE